MLGKSLAATAATAALSALFVTGGGQTYEPGNKAVTVTDPVGDHAMVNGKDSLGRHDTIDLSKVTYRVLRDRPTPVLEITYHAGDVFKPAADEGGQAFITHLQHFENPDIWAQIRSLATDTDANLVGSDRCGWVEADFDADTVTQTVPLKCIGINDKVFLDARARRVEYGQREAESRDATARSAKKLDLTYDYDAKTSKKKPQVGLEKPKPPPGPKVDLPAPGPDPQHLPAPAPEGAPR